MAKGDKNKVQNQINTTANNANNANSSVLNNTIQPQNKDFQTNYNDATTTNKNDYNSIMNNYKNIASTPASTFNPVKTSTVGYSTDPNLSSAISGYKNFADTGGYSTQDQNDLRARGVSPIRAAYSNAVQSVDRNRALSGGYSPNYNATIAKMQRTLPGELATQTSNVNAGLADAIRQGKLSGLAGLTGASEFDTGQRQNAATFNANAANNMGQFNSTGQFNADTLNNSKNLAANSGATSLYGTTPGLTNTFGNQVLNSDQQILDVNKNSQQQGQATVDQQIANAQIPSNFDTALGRIGGIARIGSSIAGGLDGLGSGISRNPLSPQDMFSGGMAV